ncbi:hypothetical protein WJX74_003874 [Apatococcus lobatus]|uniref:Uncharacterized protein n=1 Tax=Apatococcus lobatus TaxID=904363 RepID=A0AAW1SED3_9CHLO
MAISQLAVRRLVEEPAFCNEVNSKWQSAVETPADLLSRCKALTTYLRKEFLDEGNSGAAKETNHIEDAVSEYTDSDLSWDDQQQVQQDPAFEQPPEAPSTPPHNEHNDPASPHGTASTADELQQLHISRPSSVAVLTERGALRRSAAICLQRYVRGFLVRRHCSLSDAPKGLLDKAAACEACAEHSKPTDLPGLLPWCPQRPGHKAKGATWKQQVASADMADVVPSTAMMALQRAQHRAKNIQAAEDYLQMVTSERVSQLLPSSRYETADTAVRPFPY